MTSTLGVMPHLLTRLQTLLLLAPAAQTFAQSASNCEPDEQVVFSCSVGQKVASVCLTPASALQYRFGSLARTSELAFPSFPESSNRDFAFLAQSRSAKGSITNLQFVRFGVTYTIFRFAHSFEGSYAGLQISSPGKPPKRLACKESSVVTGFDRPEVEGLNPLLPSAVVE